MLRVALAVLLVLAGCSGPAQEGEPSSPTSPSPAKEPVTVTVARTGGFAGIMDTVTVKGDGSWSRPTAPKNSGQLEPAQVAKLQQLAADPRLAAEAATTAPSTMCNDAFDYIVTAGKVSVSYTDCPGDPFQPVVAMQIVDLIEDAVSP